MYSVPREHEAEPAAKQTVLINITGGVVWRHNTSGAV